MQKQISILMILGGLCFFTCKKEKDPICAEGLQGAAIIGQDFRRCVCCGGWFIDLGQDTVRTLVLPSDFKIELVPTNFPIEVCLSFQEETGPCKDFESLISVDEIVKR